MTADAWLQTFSGRQMFILEPDPSQIILTDIAVSLSHICRFLGHLDRHYSVAQHSVIVSRAMPSLDEELALAGLLHDATEAYLGDLIRPIKRFTELGRLYTELEARWQRAIEQRFALPAGHLEHSLVVQADRRALLTEKRDVVPARQPVKWEELGVEPFETKIVPHENPRDARDEFLRRFSEIAP